MRVYAASLLFLAMLAQTGLAADRIALVVGNATYESVGVLKNPRNDAEVVSRALSAVGFDVTVLIDANRDDFERGIREFGRRLREDDQAIGLFYYAGHGVQSFGENYLLPVDLALADQADLDLSAVELRSVLRQMYTAGNRANVVILDACRNNPFANAASFTGTGLAEVDAPTGSFISYATAPGKVAYDGDGDNSAFSKALAEEIVRPGQTIEQAFKRVRVAVLEETDGLQTPWDTSSLTAEFQFVAEVPLTQQEVIEREFWDAVRKTRDPIDAMLFLRAYPDSRYESEARALLMDALGTDAEGQAAEAPATEEAPDLPADVAGAGAGTVTSAPSRITPIDDGVKPGEGALIEKAQKAGTVDAYEAYLAAYPDGAFAELARFEIAALKSGTEADPVAQPDAAPEDTTTVAAVDADAGTGAPVDGEIRFTSPLPSGSTVLAGRSLSDLIQGSPLHPPVEGLPEEYWRDKTCSNCHAWDKATLCDQGTFYVTQNATRTLRTSHPYGGDFKRTIREWAKAGCQ